MNYFNQIDCQELRESSIQGRVFVDSPLEFGVPDTGLIDFGSIDVILISNYTTMMALPYITEETNFRGTVLMTEPTLHFGRIFMEEMIDYLERTATSRGSKRCGIKQLQAILKRTSSNFFHQDGRMFRRIYLTHCAMSRIPSLGAHFIQENKWNQVCRK